jgi:Leucine-rich repeat (LRR) protein
MFKKLSIILLGIIILSGCKNTNQKSEDNQAKTKLFSYGELISKKTYRSIEEAQENSDKVYKLVLFDKSLRKFPEKILEFPYLNSLELSRNQLSKLPDELATLHSLQSLYLNQNDFRKFPSVLLEIDHLKRLNLSANPLGNIPKSIDELTELEELLIDHAQIKNLPKSLFKLDINLLSLEGNQLESIPSSVRRLENLVSLNLKGNNLTRLPEDIKKCKKIKKLNLEGNPISDEHIREIKKWLPDVKLGI